jgi:hypothetical protein
MVADQQAFADSVIATNDTDEGNLLVVLRAERLHANLAHSVAGVTAPMARAPQRQPIARTA